MSYTTKGKPVGMRQRRPSARFELLLTLREAKDLHKDTKVKNRQNYRLCVRAFNRIFLWPFQLYRGEEKFPRQQVMTPYHANGLNDDLSDAFYKNLGTKKESPLWGWRMIDRREVRELYKKFTNYLLQVEKTDKKAFMDACRAFANKHNLEIAEEEFGLEVHD